MQQSTIVYVEIALADKIFEDQTGCLGKETNNTKAILVNPTTIIKLIRVGSMLLIEKIVCRKNELFTTNTTNVIYCSCEMISFL